MFGVKRPFHETFLGSYSYGVRTECEFRSFFFFAFCASGILRHREIPGPPDPTGHNREERAGRLALTRRHREQDETGVLGSHSPHARSQVPGPNINQR